MRIRDFAQELSQLINNQEPFSILPEKEESILNTLKNSIDTNNKTIGDSTLRQLATELQAKEKLLMKEQYKSNMTTILSIVSIALTVVFGVLSFI